MWAMVFNGTGEKTRKTQRRQPDETIYAEIKQHVGRKDFVHAARLALRTMDTAYIISICDQGISHLETLISHNGSSKAKAHLPLITRASAYAEMSELHRMKGDKDRAEEYLRISRSAHVAHVELSSLRRRNVSYINGGRKAISSTKRT